MKRSLFLVLVAAVSLSLNTGCSEDTTSSPSPTPQARVLVVHASPDAPGVDLLVDNQKVNQQPLTFPNNTGYLSVNAGTRNVKVNVAGTTTTVINADLPLEANRNYSVFAIDSVSKITALVTNDDLTAPAAGKAHVRFIHLSPNAPAVDVSLVGQPAGQGLFTNRTFNTTITAAQQAFTPVDAGTVNLEVRVAGTTTVALSLPNITLDAGKIYTIFARGFLGGTGAQELGAQIIVNNP
ncbi:MAG: DUF4397 domain-containing protein [Chloroherpetonaceae bacterium]